jgi:hypothetical protein
MPALPLGLGATTDRRSATLDDLVDPVGDQPVRLTCTAIASVPGHLWPGQFDSVGDEELLEGTEILGSRAELPRLLA